MPTDKRKVITLDELEVYVSNCADGCDDGFDQVIDVCKSLLKKEHGVNGYAVAVASEQFKEAVYDMLAHSHEELIGDEDTCWFEFSVSDVDALFDELPLVSDVYNPDLDEPVSQHREFTTRAMSHEICGRSARGDTSPGAW